MINTYALLDNGSQCTYIREDLTNQLELKGAKMKISISTVKSTHKQKELALTIFDINEDYELHIQKVFTMPKNMFNMLSQSHPATKEIYEEFLELKGIAVPCSSEAKVLIGSNAPHVFQQLQLCKKTHVQLYAIKTSLGWLLF